MTEDQAKATACCGPLQVPLAPLTAPTDLTYRGWHISYDPPPIPVRTCDWQFWHDDFDGAPTHLYDLGSADNRCGSAESLEAAKAEIDEHEGDPAFCGLAGPV